MNRVWRTGDLTSRRKKKYQRTLLVRSLGEVAWLGSFGMENEGARLGERWGCKKTRKTAGSWVCGWSVAFGLVLQWQLFTCVCV